MKTIIFICSVFLLNAFVERAKSHLTNVISHEKVTDCISAKITNNADLLKTIQEYTSKVRDYEIPFISEQTSQDSVIYYVSAFNHTRAMLKNPPNAITTIGGKEVIVYRIGKKLNKNCQMYLIEKYQKLLSTDKFNTSNGYPTDTKVGSTYDPIWVRIVVIAGKIVKINNEGNPNRNVPNIDYDS